MVDFLDALDVESELRKNVEKYLEEIEAKSLVSLLKHSKRNDWYKCPICWRAITTFKRFLIHFRFKKNLWEFYRLQNIYEKLPQSFHYYQHDYKHGDHLGKLYDKVKLWVVAKKILHQMNPRPFLILNKGQKWK